ncbi:DUF2278 family protein [Ralstonia pseudosolanacearum]|uniref:DUF2278 family protein n=1 Tax=Ralstonia pseudosolanacearum TaxID=1310165 RepID=UPI003CF7A482
MPLPGYGILYGTVVTARPPRANETHWLLIVQPLDLKHPTYRAAIQLVDAKIGIQAQWSNLSKGSPAAQDVAKRLQATHSSGGAPGNFLTAQDCKDGQKIPGLDYIRSGIVNKGAFQATTNTPNDLVSTTFSHLVRPGAGVVICGTGLPINSATDSAPSTGFTGIGNVHMNQGTRTWIGNRGHHDENGTHQDGALFVLNGRSVWALFLKYANQSLDTDANGDPQDSGVASIDRVRARARPVVSAYLQARATEDAATAASIAQPTTANPKQAAAGFVFQDPANSEVNDPFIADDDHAVINNPVSQDYAKGKTRAPEYIKGNQPLVMRLEDVRGKTFVDSLTNRIAFDFIGDTGATSASSYTGEKKVTAQLCALAKNDPPAFCFHVGDVVYFYGEGNYFPCQFGAPFKDYPAPIFAIPGNHDACVYDDQHKPLEAFIEVFCADKPSNTGVLGGFSRTTMTQPGVYFTLDAPFVSIIGLFSGAAESQRYMSAQQIQHFYSELLRLQQLRAQGEKRAIILAVHHLPQFYANTPDAVSTGLDTACQHAGLWPDAVVVGHAHLYQRFVRTVGDQQIPYIVDGNGGYHISPGQDAKVAGHSQVTDNLVKKVLGFVRANCDGKSLSFRAVDENGQDIDQLSVDLAKKTVRTGP